MKDELVRCGLVKHGLVKHGLVKYGFCLLLALGLALNAYGQQVPVHEPVDEPGDESGHEQGHEQGHETSQTTPSIKPNVIRWGTASEQGNFGYDVFRGLFEDGPFAPVNPDVIPGAGTTDIPQRYEFRDDSIEPDTEYWYYIESISLNGERKRISPIYASEPKPLMQVAE